MTTQPEAMIEDRSFSQKTQEYLDIKTLQALSRIDCLYVQAVRELTQESEKRDSGEAEDAPLKKQREQRLDDAKNVLILSNRARYAYARLLWSSPYYYRGIPTNDLAKIKIALRHQKIQPYQIIPRFNGSKEEAPEAVMKRWRANHKFFMVFSEKAAAEHGYAIGEVTDENGTRQEIKYTGISDNKNWAQAYCFPDARVAFSAQNEGAAKLKVRGEFSLDNDFVGCLKIIYNKNAGCLPIGTPRLKLKTPMTCSPKIPPV